MADLTTRLVRGAGMAMQYAYLRRIGVSPADVPYCPEDWDMEARAAVAAVLNVLVFHGERHEHFWLDRVALEKIADALKPASTLLGGDGRRDQAPRVAPPTQAGGQ